MSIKSTDKQTLEMLNDYMRTPVKIAEYFCTQPGSIKMKLQRNDAVGLIKALFTYEIEDGVKLSPELHLFNINHLLNDTVRNDSKEIDTLLSLLADTPDLTLCLTKLYNGSVLTVIDGFYCTQEIAMQMLDSLDDDELHHYSYHIEYHGIPHDVMLRSLHAKNI